MRLEEVQPLKTTDELATVRYSKLNLIDSCGIRDRRIQTFGSWGSIEEFCENMNITLIMTIPLGLTLKP